MKKLFFSTRKLLSFLMAIITTFCALGTANLVTAVSAFGAYAAESVYPEPVVPAPKEPVYKYTVRNGEATIISFEEGTTDEIVIPDMIDGYKVAEIGESAFSGTSIRSVTIPDGVKTIGLHAFYGCLFLEDVKIPDSVTTIDGYAFGDCCGLVNIELPDNMEFIGAEAFYGTGFYKDSSNWEDGVLYIGNYLIKASGSVSGLYEIRENTEMISSGAFMECRYLTDVIIPGTTENIGSYAFRNCENLSGVIISEGVKNIGEAAFSDTNLYEITIPDSVEIIGSHAFLSCDNLTDITITDNVKSIGEYAFYGTGYYHDYEYADGEGCCVYLGNYLIGIDGISESQYIKIRDNTIIVACEIGFRSEDEKIIEVYVPETVSYIEPNSFRGSVERITVAEENPYYCSDEYGVLYNKEKTALICCPELMPETRYVIPDGVETIGFGAFWRCDSLVDVVFPSSVKRIEDYAFCKCTSLNTVILHGNLEYIGEMAFSNCKNISDIVLPSSLRDIGVRAFVSCDIKDLTIPDGVLNIGYSAFVGCESLQTVSIPASVVNIDDSAFGGCESLKKIAVSEENRFYSNDEHGVLFDKDKTLLIRYPNDKLDCEYVIPDSTVKIETYAFGGSDNLKSITIPKMNNIYSSSFSNCSNLTDVYFMGTIEQWNRAYIVDYDDELADATIHYQTSLTTENNDNVVVEFFDDCFGVEVKPSIIEKNKNSNFWVYVEVDGRLVYNKLICKYEISMIAENGEKVQPQNGKVTVKIKLPDGYDDVNKEKLSILHYWDKESGNEKILSDRIEIKNGYVIFDVEHFSEFYVCLESDAPAVQIRNNPGVATINYGDSIKLTADTTNLTEDMQIIWYINGEKMGVGETFSTTIKSDVEISAKIADFDGNILADENGNEISDTQKIKVKDNLWLRIVSFFKNLFGINRVLVQTLF